MRPIWACWGTQSCAPYFLSHVHLRVHHCREVTEAGAGSQLVTWHPQSGTERNKCTHTACLLVNFVQSHSVWCSSVLRVPLSVNTQDNPPRKCQRPSCLRKYELQWWCLCDLWDLSYCSSLCFIYYVCPDWQVEVFLSVGHNVEFQYMHLTCSDLIRVAHILTSLPQANCILTSISSTGRFKILPEIRKWQSASDHAGSEPWERWCCTDGNNSQFCLKYKA